MRALVLQHIACEPPGVYEDVAEVAERAPAMLDRGRTLFTNWLNATVRDRVEVAG